MITWISNRIARRQRGVRRSGHVWAAGELLSGALPLDFVEHMCDNPWERRTAFEDGMPQACADWRKLTRRTE